MRIIELDERNKIIKVRYDSSVNPDKNEVQSDTGLIGQIMDTDRVFVNDIYVDDTDIANKIIELKTKCGIEIVNNFYSSAKGDVLKHYDFEIHDQVNLLGIIGKIYRKNLNGYLYYATDEECEQWTTEELDKLIEDGEEHKTTLLTKYKTLKYQAEQVTLKTELESIKW